MYNIPPLPPPKKPSSVISWLGFGISLGTLLMIILFGILDSASYDYAFIMLSLLLAMSVGLLGLIFSIIGIFIAIKKDTPRWMSVCGIIFCCLYLPAMILAPILSSTKKSKLPQETECAVEEPTSTLSASPTPSTIKTPNFTPYKLIKH
ncbi:MAG: hypothetical protein NC210_09315 [[Clostridium] fimetarium]|nr:hypothetical protein [Alistipes timonensis]MCM1406609.1 hypothetical protein [[Clostridium] fimetarium]